MAYFRQIGNRFQIEWTLFPAKGAVQIGTDTYVQTISRQLTNMVDMSDDLLEITAHRFGGRYLSDPSGHEHPGIKSRADDGIPADQFPELFIRKLSVVRYQGAAVVVAGPHRAIKVIHRLPESIITKVRGIQYHAQ